MLFTTFTGFLAGGIWGAIIATFFVFLPSFVFVLAGARYIEMVRDNRWIQAFLCGYQRSSSWRDRRRLTRSSPGSISRFTNNRPRLDCDYL